MKKLTKAWKAKCKLYKVFKKLTKTEKTLFINNKRKFLNRHLFTLSKVFQKGERIKHQLKK